MDKAIIFGAFEFVGFYLCREFLEKGYEVTGILLDHSAKNYVEEKRFEIGRNANFKEQTIEEWEELEEDDTSNILIVLPLYDLFIGSKEKLLKREILNKPLFQNKDTENQIICLLPVQSLKTFHSNDMNELRDFLEMIKEIRNPKQIYYLPTIFGPWQPPEFIFQKSLLNILKENEEQSQAREWMLDAVFVEDAVNTIFEKIESECPGQFILESGMTNQWVECANFLNIDPQFRQSTASEELTVDGAIIRLPVKNITPVSKSLSIQKEHLKHLPFL